MKQFILAVFISCLCNVSSFSQNKVFKPQKVKEYAWDDEKALWKEQTITLYKYNNHGEILEETTRDIYQKDVFKIVRTISNTNQPLSETYYIYDSINSTWKQRGDTKYSYNTTDLLVLQEYEYYDIDNSFKKSRSVFVYDNKSRMVESYIEQWVNGSWVKTSGGKTIFTDSASVTKSVLVMYWNSDSSAYVNVSKTDFNFDEKENIVKETSYYWANENNTSSWKTNYIKENTYNAAGEISDYSIRRFIGGETVKHANIVWYDYNKKLRSGYISQHWNPVKKQWQNYRRYTYTYPDSLTQTELTEDWGNNTWYALGRQTTLLNSSSGEIDELTNETKDSSGNWEIEYQVKNFYKYDNEGKLFEKIRKRYNPNTKQLDNYVRYTYDDYTEILGVQNKPGIFTDINIYPIPAKDVINIKIELQKASLANILLTDITGKVVYYIQQNLKQAENKITIDTKELKAGIYILKIETENGNFYSQKIVKTE